MKTFDPIFVSNVSNATAATTTATRTTKQRRDSILSSRRIWSLDAWCHSRYQIIDLHLLRRSTRYGIEKREIIKMKLSARLPPSKMYRKNCTAWRKTSSFWRSMILAHLCLPPFVGEQLCIYFTFKPVCKCCRQESMWVACVMLIFCLFCSPSSCCKDLIKIVSNLPCVECFL